jgi:hypothetical protein
MSTIWLIRIRANTDVKVRIHVKDRADARPAITAAEVKIPVKAKVAARRPRTAAKGRMAAPQVAKFCD